MPDENATPADSSDDSATSNSFLNPSDSTDSDSSANANADTDADTGSVSLIDALPNRPLDLDDWDSLEHISGVIGRRPLYTMGDDKLGSFLLEIIDIGWRGYHYVPEDGQWYITFSGDDYNVVLDMHKDYVEPHIRYLDMLENEAQEKKEEILEQQEKDRQSDTGAAAESGSSGSTPGDDSDEESDVSPDSSSDTDLSSDTDPNATASAE